MLLVSGLVALEYGGRLSYRYVGRAFIITQVFITMKITQTKLILYTSIFFVLFDNLAFFQHVITVYPINAKNIWFLASLTGGLTGFTMLVFTLVSSRYTTKPILIFFLLISSLASYFMNNYNVVIDHIMIQNLLQTNLAESSDLITARLLYCFLFLGVLPALLVVWMKIEPTSLKRAIIVKIRDVILCLLIIFGLILLFSKFYTSFFREHKPLRYYTNPSYYIYSAGKYINRTYFKKKVHIRPLGEDANNVANDPDRELIILVIGEAVRADRLSLNGYQLETNPLLAKEDVISFTNVHSCGTSTSYSIPCMFSIYPRDEYSDSKGASNENLLDVLTHAKVNVLWRDNNSDSKGVADRVQYQDYKLRQLNPVCDVECRDVGMLVGLQEYIDNHKDGDILIVLHQMGNHGPAYYKRYPASFEKFTPVCRTSQFDECTQEEISNAYDNAILYTDYFLTQTIELLKENSDRFETAMVYMSDHGESLGEYGVYLHGLPYSIAPESQTHIGSIFWFGDSFKIDRQALREKSNKPYSHDNLLHTMLGLLEVKTSIYDKSLDILNN